MPLFARAAYAAGTEPTTLLLLRFALAAVVLVALAVLRGAAIPRGRTLGLLALMGGVAYVGQSLSYFVALTMTSAALLALLLYVYPVLVAVLATLLFRVPLTRARLVALGFAVAGAALTIGPVGGAGWPGIALGLLSALIYSGYILAGTRLSGRADALTSSTVITASAAVVFAFVSALHGLAPPASLSGWLAVLAISLVSTVIAVLAFLAGLARIGPTDAATLSTLEPAVTAVLSVAILGESLGAMQVLGGGLIVVAAIVVARSRVAARPSVALA
jgi:drug/metabolite transporter (DMT)-like permease